MNFRKKLFYTCIMIIGTITVSAGMAELCTRIFLAVYWKPSILLYGTALGQFDEYSLGLNVKKFWGERRWDTIIGGNEATWQTPIQSEFGTYRKYPPGFHRPMVLPDGTKYTSVLNNNGMRGRDFQQEKKPGTVRVITLGASSTYGYRNKDDETYPYYLELCLNNELARQNLPAVSSFEVFNFGMPQFYPEEIRALFMNEALSYRPDIVTFYEGANETRRIKREKPKEMLLPLYGPLEWAGKKSLLARYLTFIFDRYVETFSAEDVKAQIAGKPDFFVAQIQSIAKECRTRGIIFIPITQSLNSESLSRAAMAKTGYDAEVEIVRHRLENGGRIGPQELMLLIHAELMAKLRAWSAAEKIPLLDFITAIERGNERAGMQNWVHLHAAGNRLLARELCTSIFNLMHAAADEPMTGAPPHNR